TQAVLSHEETGDQGRVNAGKGDTWVDEICRYRGQRHLEGEMNCLGLLRCRLGSAGRRCLGMLFTQTGKGGRVTQVADGTGDVLYTVQEWRPRSERSGRRIF